jgi:hypothetical protein
MGSAAKIEQEVSSTLADAVLHQCIQLLIGACCAAMMHGPEKSDSAIVAGKPTNKAERSAAELVEPKAETKGNADQQSTTALRRTASRQRMNNGSGGVLQLGF